MDTADEHEQARVADALADFLHADQPVGAAYRAARQPTVLTDSPHPFGVETAGSV
jgi:hypothetical protein